MSNPTPLPRRPRARAAALGAASLGAAAVAALAGCSAAAGPDAANPALGPVRAGHSALSFAPFPVPSAWDGLHNRAYDEVVKAKTGTAARHFRVILRPEMVFWLNCLGSGTATLSSPAAALHWSLPCGAGSDPHGLTVAPPARAVGHGADVLVTVTPGAHWEVRIDGLAAPR